MIEIYLFDFMFDFVIEESRTAKNDEEFRYLYRGKLVPESFCHCFDDVKSVFLFYFS